MEAPLSDLQDWYAAQCDGDWEHRLGVAIGTLDNPGWSLRVDLEDTLLEGKPFERLEQTVSEDTWMTCFVENSRFVGFAGPQQLHDLIATFVSWAKTEPDWLAVECETESQAREREDRRLWSLLGDEDGAGECRTDGCPCGRTRYSVFCREHHFEMVRGYKPPEFEK